LSEAKRQELTEKRNKATKALDLLSTALREALSGLARSRIIDIQVNTEQAYKNIFKKSSAISDPKDPSSRHRDLLQGGWALHPVARRSREITASLFQRRVDSGGTVLW
jgi:hypothetical protein